VLANTVGRLRLLYRATGANALAATGDRGYATRRMVETEGVKLNYTEAIAMEEDPRAGKIKEEALELVYELEHSALLEDNPVKIRKFEADQERILKRLERLDGLVSPIYSKRNQDFTKLLAEKIAALEEKQAGFSELLEDNKEQVATAVAYSMQIAMRTRQKEKLEALSNAVINSALPNAPEEDVQLMFLTFVESFGVSHLKILSYIENPQGWLNKKVMEQATFTVPLEGGLHTEPDWMLKFIFPKMQTKSDYFYQIFDDLEAKGLILRKAIEMPYEMLKPGVGMRPVIRQEQPKITNFGKQFLQFIKSGTENESKKSDHARYPIE